MRIRPTLAALGVLLGGFAVVVAASAAHAFTIENKDTEGAYSVPKFNLEEQAKRFSKDGADSSTAGKTDFSTPLGPGTLYFGAGAGPGFGSGFVPSSGTGPRDMRNHFERVVTPENLR